MPKQHAPTLTVPAKIANVAPTVNVAHPIDKLFESRKAVLLRNGLFIGVKT